MIDYVFLFCAFATGFLTKLVDLEEHGIKLRSKAFYVSALLYGFLIAYAGLLKPQIGSLIFAVILSLVVTKKIDSRAHMLGGGSFLFFTILLGIPEINLVYMFIFFIAATIDEIVNTRIYDAGKIKNNFLSRFVEARPILEITALVVSFFTGVWVFWYGIFFYDLGYILTNKSFMKFVK